MGKTFVTVLAEHDPNGKTEPLALTWTNGEGLFCFGGV